MVGPAKPVALLFKRRKSITILITKYQCTCVTILQAHILAYAYAKRSHECLVYAAVFIFHFPANYLLVFLRHFQCLTITSQVPNPKQIKTDTMNILRETQQLCMHISILSN